MQQDRFFVNLQTDSITWMYHNPDAVSGDQFVCNVFDIELMQEAIANYPIGADTGWEPTKVYDYIAENCRQFLSDIGMEAYEWNKEQFFSEPISVGMTHTTLETLSLVFAAKKLIDEYSVNEFDKCADFSDLKQIAIGYTTDGDGKHQIEMYANIIDHRTEIHIDGVCAATSKSISLKSYVENQLPYLDFGEMVGTAEKAINLINRIPSIPKDTDCEVE